jgi:hypothetical protein
MAENLMQGWNRTRQGLDESRARFTDWTSQLRTGFARGMQETTDALKNDMARATTALRAISTSAISPALEAPVEEAEKSNSKNAKNAKTRAAKKPAAGSKPSKPAAQREKQWYED